tara:strand:- start:3735 stop:5624 length:1890 start_codon:yes stop_codon:yes gene_type:complete
MKILIVSQYFWPEYFRVNDLVTEFKKKDFEVEILTSYPNYPEGKIFKDFKINPKKYSKFQNCKVYRVPQISRGNSSLMRLTLNYLSFMVSSLFFSIFFLRKKNYDYVFTFATSPIIVAITSIIISKINKCKHILWVLDLWPNVLDDLNIFKKKSFIYRLCEKIVKYIYKNTYLILCQSLTYKKKINSLDSIFCKKTFFFPSWPEESKQIVTTNSKKDENVFPNNKHNLLFTGNIGDAQNFGLILDLVRITRKEINWIIAGKGRRFNILEEAKKKFKLDNLKLLGMLKFEDLHKYVQHSDALLISLKSGDAFDATIPGKFQTYLSYKKKLVGLIGGEVFDIINKYNIGFATKTKNIEKVKIELLNYLSSEFDQNKFEKNIQILNKIYSKKRNINRLINIFNLLKVKRIIKYLTSSEQLPFNKNFVLSAFNLAFCSALQKNYLTLSDDFYVWPDGYYFNKVSKLKEPKLPGRKLLSNLELPEFIEEIVVLGNLSPKGQIFLENHFKKKIIHKKLPFGELDDFKQHVPIFKKEQICILTLPTPKQEILAEYIMSYQENYKILCLGGAINMASGEERPLPEYLEKIFIAETIWRLQFETLRRIARLSSSFVGYLKGKRNRIYEKLEFRKINEK